MPWRQAREQSRSNNQNGVTFGKLRSLVITSNHSGLDSYLQELPATLEPRALETKLGALWPQAKVHGLNKWSEAYTTPAPKQGGGSQAEDLCAQPSALHQTESQTQLEPARGKRRSRRKRLPAYSRDLVQLSLDVAQAKHTSQNEQASQRIIAQETARKSRPPLSEIVHNTSVSTPTSPSRKERERESRNGTWESWYQEDWYDNWPDQDRWSWRNPHPRDEADADWGSEEEEEYEDTEEDDAEDRDLSADSRESYENATPDLLASQEEPNPSTTGKQEIQKHTGQ
eukprot:s5314_g1.t1